ncbi:unnamed protein product [Didymodactylos carnosus]|uniref:Uncharacterized protein n=1 Tax=Didymodactylos carnosus TaxID=1234261 RepID=A0A8S2EFF0_9BILA|nr:unnamed protein product [Didymodactylos carnosus]CAF3912241.1 unnamed protein product [Didymodactylos carnosus]
MSIRNAPVDIAQAKILQYLRTHNYDECVIYINRLSPLTFRKILATLSIDILLTQLPFSLEIFEVIYSKIFLYDPDQFPIRTLKPDRFLSKILNIFASSINTNDQLPSQKGLDVDKMMTKLESILRIISYVQPILFKRLLRQKQTIDSCLFYFEHHSIQSSPTSILPKHKQSAMSLTSLNSSKLNQLQETLRSEIETTITCCQNALQKLNEYRKLQPTSILSMTGYYSDIEKLQTISSSPSTPTTSAHSTPIFKKSISHQQHLTYSTRSSFHSLNDVQTRLLTHKSLLNVVEPFLSKTKLFNIIDSLNEKVNVDKEILLAYSHIKTQEKQITTNDALLPLFKRYALAYERIIQLWRKVSDSTLIDDCPDDVLIDNGERFNILERARSEAKTVFLLNGIN